MIPKSVKRFWEKIMLKWPKGPGFAITIRVDS
jgi:hypothetical protein